MPNRRNNDNMKRVISFLLAALVILGCSKPGILEVSSSSLSFSSGNDTQRVDISSTGAWRASASASWCHLIAFNTQGVSFAYVEIQCDANPDLTERTCFVTISSGELSSQINVIQAAKKGAIIKTESLDISADEQDVKIPIEHNISYNVSISKEDQSWVSIVSGTKVVETTDLVLHVKRNTGIEGRTAAIKISTGYDDGQWVFVNQEKGKVNENAANCYLVSSPGSHSFNALYKGRTFDTVGTLKSAKVIWETFNDDTPIQEGDLISSCSLNAATGEVSYTINSAAQNGNAIIAVFSGDNGTGTILWSWHIWYVEGYDAVASAEKYPSGRIFMDRNLGAVSAQAKNPKTNGLLYQWGRKDPFPGKVFTDGTATISATNDFNALQRYDATGTYPTDIDYSIANPLTFVCNWNETKNGELWGGEISLYNPCPNGWTIPKGIKSSTYGDTADDGDWFGIKSENFEKFTTTVGGAYYTDKNGNNISWYPGSGRRLNNNGDIEWFGNQSFFYWSQTMEYVMSGVLTNVMGTNSYFFYDIRFGSYTQDSKGANPAHAFSVRCVKE